MPRVTTSWPSASSCRVSAAVTAAPRPVPRTSGWVAIEARCGTSGRIGSSAATATSRPPGSRTPTQRPIPTAPGTALCRGLAAASSARISSSASTSRSTRSSPGTGGGAASVQNQSQSSPGADPGAHRGRVERLDRAAGQGDPADVLLAQRLGQHLEGEPRRADDGEHREAAPSLLQHGGAVRPVPAAADGVGPHLPAQERVQRPRPGGRRRSVRHPDPVVQPAQRTAAPTSSTPRAGSSRRGPAASARAWRR